jgi:oligoendopeptidase F
MFSYVQKNAFFQVLAETASIPERKEIEEKYTWNLKDIYSNDGDWEKDFKWVEEKLNEYQNYRGRLTESTQLFLACLQLDDSIGIKLERLHLYSMLSKDSDLRVNKFQSMDDRIRSLYSKVGAVSSFIRPELLKIPADELMEMINSNEDLKVYKHSIENLIRLKEHTLSDSEEKILALAAEIEQTPYNAFSMFTNADLKLPFVEDDKGNSTQLSHARFYSAMYSKNQDFRERSFKGYLGSYKDYINTLTALLNGNLKTNIFNAKARNYNSALEAALDRNNISIPVYDKLIQAANKNLSPLHRWASFKKELLGLNILKPFDVYVSLFDEELEKKYPYDEAVNIVLDSLKIMGEDYINSLKTAFENRWIDVYETKAKKSGAYSSGTTFGVHPYVLLNWTDLLNDVFTLAHEMGHNMHSFYTGKTQPYPYANYSIFLAEVASTFNEALLLEYLIDHSDKKEEKLFLMEKYLNNITSTFYRQVMFAEFEKIIYDKTESGEALTSEVYCRLYKDIYQKYWGPEMEVIDEESYTWSRIPHFYYNFYVYQYATGFAASEALVKRVKSEGEPAVEKYLNFLKAGSSDYPINILNTAGVNMNSEKPVLAVSEKMNSILDEMEELL